MEMALFVDYKSNSLNLEMQIYKSKIYIITSVNYVIPIVYLRLYTSVNTFVIDFSVVNYLTGYQLYIYVYMCIYGLNKSLFALSGHFIEQICRFYFKIDWYSVYYAS